MVSPLLLSQIMSDTAVRNNQMLQESSLLGIRMLINQWGVAQAESYRQLLHILKQYKTTLHEQIEDETRKLVPSMRSIEINGYNIDKDKNIIAAEGVYDYDLNGDVLDSFDSLGITIDVQSSALASKALQARELQETMTLVMNVFSNPQLSQNKIIMELLKKYLEKKGVDNKVLSYFQEDESDETEMLALYQNEQMMKGQEEPPIAGMSDNHLMAHVDLLNRLVVQYLEVMQSDPEGSQELLQKMQMVQSHIAGDSQLKMQEVQGAMEMANGVQTSAMPPERNINQPIEQI
jgi:hypothetical protein